MTKQPEREVLGFLEVIPPGHTQPDWLTVYAPADWETVVRKVGESAALAGATVIVHRRQPDGRLECVGEFAPQSKTVTEQEEPER